MVKAGSPRMSSAIALAGSPNAKRSVVTCWKRMRRIRYRPSTVPNAQRHAAPGLEQHWLHRRIPVVEDAARRARERDQPDAGERRHEEDAEERRGRSFRTTQAPITATIGCTF